MIHAEIVPQQVILYTQTMCYNRMKDHSCLDQYYDARFYENQTSFNIDTNEEVIIVLRNCNQHWFRQALSYEMRFVQNRWTVTSEHPWQPCLLIRNRSETTALHVEENTTLSALLEQPEIIYKSVHIRQVDLQMFQYLKKREDAIAEEEEDEEEEEDDAVKKEEEEINMRDEELDNIPISKEDAVATAAIKKEHTAAAAAAAAVVVTGPY